jgi:phage head maturation protease
MENELPRTDIFRAFQPSLELIERDGGDPPSLNIKFAVFERWAEINSAFEGRFMERIAPGAFKKTIRENLSNIKVLLSHGKDPSLGMTVLGSIDSLREEADGPIARVNLFRSVPQLLLDGLRAGVYGASFRAKPIKEDVNYMAGRSDYNPNGLPEVTRQEVRLVDFGPTPFPQYDGTSVVMRSMTDELVLAELLRQPQVIRDLLEQGAAALERSDEPEPEEATTPPPDEPQHSAEDVPEVEREEEPEWLLKP